MMGVVQPADVRPGQVIFLNGASSSGKSSIARELLDVMEGPYFHLAVDAFNGMRAKRRTLELSPAELTAVLARTRAGFHRAATGTPAPPRPSRNGCTRTVTTTSNATRPVPVPGTAPWSSGTSWPAARPPERSAGCGPRCSAPAPGKRPLA
jgi:Chloramphenicol phosphotransferase-like protein